MVLIMSFYKYYWVYRALYGLSMSCCVIILSMWRCVWHWACRTLDGIEHVVLSMVLSMLYFVWYWACRTLDGIEHVVFCEVLKISCTAWYWACRVLCGIENVVHCMVLRMSCTLHSAQSCYWADKAQNDIKSKRIIKFKKCKTAIPQVYLTHLCYITFWPQKHFFIGKNQFSEKLSCITEFILAVA